MLSTTSPISCLTNTKRRATPRLHCSSAWCWPGNTGAKPAKASTITSNRRVRLMDYTTILVERDQTAPIATVTVNRPDKLNALNSTVLRELSAAFAELEADENVRA